MIDPKAVQADQIGFQEAVYQATRLIPAGKVLGYGHLATLIGQPGRARHVGSALKSVMQSDQVPWWRVVRSNGAIVSPQASVQKQRLEEENITFQGKNVDMRKCRWFPEVT